MEKKWNVNDIIDVINKTLSKKNENNKTFQNRFKERKKRDHSIIEEFQEQLVNNLSVSCNNTLQGCEKEYALFGKIDNWKTIKDRADIRIEKINLNGNDYELIIEIDATRADQVAKKMMSRFCYATLRKGDLPIVYVALLYKGTSSMNSDECKKFFRMGYELIKKINESNIMIGYIIGDNNSHYIFPNDNKSQECNNCSIDINDDEAFDSDQYRRYLEDHGVQTPASIECYMLPHNQFYSSEDPGRCKSDLIKAYNFNRFIERYGGKNAYWQKYQDYLKESKAKENDDKSK